jgi:protochlorophyllide reductase
MPSFEFDFGGGNAAGKGKKLCVITGASSGLGLEATRSLTCDRDDYYVIAAVRDVAKMNAEAERLGISTSKYSALKCDLADFSSVRQFVKDLKQFKGSRPLDTLCCNAAVYRPTDPEPAFSADGFELSMASNHLGHFLLCNLVIEDMAKNKAKDARVIIVGSITGNSNTVGGGLVYPRADVGQFQGWEAIANGEKRPEEMPMVDGKSFFGAKAYKDTKVALLVRESFRASILFFPLKFSLLYLNKKHKQIKKGFEALDHSSRDMKTLLCCCACVVLHSLSGVQHDDHFRAAPPLPRRHWHSVQLPVPRLRC